MTTPLPVSNHSDPRIYVANVIDKEIERLQNKLDQHDCHGGEEDGCICDEAREHLEILYKKKREL